MKEVVAAGLHSLAHASGASAFLSRAQHAWRILMFHGIGGLEYPTEVFEAQIRYLCRHFRVRPLSWLVPRLSDPDSRPDREVVLTFDDGLRNNCSVAYPILKRLGVPATFFVCPGLVESGRWLWNHEARERLLSLSPEDRALLARRLGVAEAAESIVAWMKTLPTEARMAAEAEIRSASAGFSPSSEQHERFDMASWEEILSLDPSIVSVGSHSLTHPIVCHLDGEALTDEIVGSRRNLEERLGRSVDTFCYPNGAMTTKVDALVRKTYAAAVTTKESLVGRGQDPYTLPRVPTSVKTPLLAWRLHHPAS